jgi:hypothetical protein
VSAEVGDEVGHGWISAFPTEGDSTTTVLVKKDNGSNGSYSGGKAGSEIPRALGQMRNRAALTVVTHNFFLKSNT